MELSDTYNLKALFPGLAKQWHPTKNGKLTPDAVTPGSNKKVWWICDKGHEWKTAVKNRRRGSGCHYCAVNKQKRKNAASS